MSHFSHDISGELPVWRRPLTAILLCAALLCFVLIPEVANFILSWDRAAAVQLNRLAGSSPVLDYLIRFIAEHDGRDRLLVAMLITVVVVLWRSSNSDVRLRRLALFLYIMAAVGAVLLTIEYLEDVVGRKSPSMSMRQFRDVEAIYDWDLDLTDKHTFPSVEALMLFLPGFMLLRLGATRVAIGFLLAGGILPLGRCIFGTTWVTDIYLGSAPIAFLLSAVAIETPVVQFHYWLHSRLISSLDQATLLLPRWKPFLTHGRRVWTSQNVFMMECGIKRYVAEDLPKLLEAGGKTPVGPIRMEVPLGGLQSIIRIVSLGSTKVVLRAYPLARRQSAERHRTASELMNGYGVRVPAVYAFADERHKYNTWFIIEEFVDGTCPRARELTDDQINAAAAELAKMHMVLSSRWGAVGAERSESYSDVLLRRVNKRLMASQAFGKNSDDIQNQQKILAWFESWRATLDRVSEYHLIHGKLHRENALFGPDGRFCLLDNTTIEWGIPAEDLVQIHTSLCEGDPEVIRRFDAAYFPLLPANIAQVQRNLLPFYETYMVLAHLSKYAKRMNRRRGKQRNAMGTQRLRAQVSLLELINTVQPPRA